MLTIVDEQINADIAAGFPGAGLITIKDNHIIKHDVYGYMRHSAFVNGRFEDDNLATGNYTKITTLIYQALNSLGD